jgi:hypothetical protein
MIVPVGFSKSIDKRLDGREPDRKSGGDSPSEDEMPP